MDVEKASSVNRTITMPVVRLAVHLFRLQSLLLIIATASGSAQLNQNCTVAVLNRTVQANPDGSWVVPNIPANFGPVRARATCLNNGTTEFGQSDFFTIPTNGITKVPQITFGSATPVPTVLNISSTATTLSDVGATAQLTVTASYASGPEQDVTASSGGTQYIISNPKIATVSADGLVTAVSSGTVVIQATNEGRQAITSIQVVIGSASHGGIPDSWAIANGLDVSDPAMPSEDPDHDGLTNLQEFQKGTDPNKQDTDGDGLTDGQEVLVYQTNPAVFSTDGTGIPDGIEVQTGTLNNGDFNAKLAAALSSLEVRPSSFALSANTIQGQAPHQQLTVLGHLIDGKTTLNLTSITAGTSYSSSNLNVCNFGTPDGNVFAGADGSCTITVSNNGFPTQATGVIHNFSPTALSFVSIPGFANAVDVNGNYAYVAAGGAGLQVVNVSNRTSPSIVGSLLLPGNANDVKLLGNLAYVAGGFAGLQVIDISNPASPVLRGTLNTGGNALKVVVRGTTAYIANQLDVSGDYQSNLVIADVTSPGSMRRIATLPFEALIQGVDVSTTRNLAAVAGGSTYYPGGGAVYMIDISNPAAPAVLGSVFTGDPRDVVMQGNFAFVADFQNSTTSIDITNPSAPAVLSHITNLIDGGRLLDITLSGSFALAADVYFTNGIPITDISNPPNLSARATLNFTQRDDNGMGIAADGMYVYLATEHDSIDKFGFFGDSRLYIGQYLNPVDDQIAPTATITSPAAGTTVIEGTTLPITVNASDDVGVASVNFLVNRQVVFTSTAAPYQYNFTVPTGVTSITLGATSTDLRGNVGTAQNVIVNVIPDPGTTVTGKVVDTSQTPLAGATVTTLGGLSATTQADGSFSIAGVSTLSRNLTVTTSGSVNGVSLRGSSSVFAPVRGGTTNVGTIVAMEATFHTDFGTLVVQCGNCSVQRSLPFPFTYFGVTYNSVFVNNLGSVSFDGADGSYLFSTTDFSDHISIRPFWDDLIWGSGTPVAGKGLYVNDTLPGRFIVTWLDESIEFGRGEVTIQMILFADGRIQFAYNGIALHDLYASNPMIGITPGGGTPTPLLLVDYRSDPPFRVSGRTGILEEFAPSAFNLDGGFVSFTPNTGGNYDVQFIAPPTLAGSATLRGTAYGDHGIPIAGAEVNVTCSRDLSYKGVATTDQNGFYTLSGVPLGGITVGAFKNGAQVGVGEGIVQSSGTATIDLFPPQ